ncbi:MAG TPA: hypothetical protein VLI04_21795 [Nocardioidaceae bacterium]|nr:hypothetical protein [Nocardioidaceae bacterium]
MNRVFALGLTSAAFGLIIGAALGISAGSMHAFVYFFALVTLLGCLAGAVYFGRHTQETPDGFVGLGDTFLAMGTLVALVESVALSLTGGFLGLVYGCLGLALTLFALKQERQVSIAVSGVLSILVLSWVMTDSAAIVLGTVPGLFWLFATGAYVASLASGEQVEAVGEALSA